MTWLALAYLLSAGTLDYNACQPSINFVQSPPDSFQTTLGLEAQMIDNHVFAGGTIETWETSDVKSYFSPWESLYTFNAGLRFGGFEAGYRHECDHITLGTFNPPPGFFANKDEVYASFRATIKVF